MKYSFSLRYAWGIPMAAFLCCSPAVAAQETLEPAAVVEQIRLRPGALPSVSLTGDILYRILASEIAAREGNYELGSQVLLDLARETSDPRLAQRSFQFAMANRDTPQALRSARMWSLLEPDSPEAVAASLALTASSGQTAGLAGALRGRIEKAQDKEQAIVQASAIISKMADKRVALDVLERALTPEARDLPVAHLALADAAWEALEPVRALQEARQALVLDPDSEAAAQRILEYGLKVNADQAVADAKAFLADYPDSGKLQMLLVNRLTERRDYDGALAQVRDMRRRTPENFDLLFVQADINTRAQRYDAAKTLLNEYIDIQGQRRRSLNDKATNAAADASDARLMLVQIAEKEGKLGEAIAQLDLIDEPAVRFQAQVHKAVLQARQGNIDVARKTIDGLQPQDDQERAIAVLTLASIYREAGRTDMAIELLVEADQTLRDSPEIKYDLAMLYESQGKFEQFEALMERVIELDPNNANALNALGYTYADQNRRLDEAQGLLERALDLDPNNPYILDSVGWYLYRIGDNEGAAEYLERSYRQLPAADVAAHLGEVYWTMGRRDQARKIWRGGLAKEPDNATLLKTLKRFNVELK
jgi:tetratricopeptide (TPR) repeat protein